ncbi:MAG: sulfatase, partial [Saprospiraceae bacterium]|nr:sulfatase [Saprospiraceae bacterium]
MVLSAVTAFAQPNILFIISDDLNTKIGPYMDIDQHTPNLDRLAGEGVRFDRTYCQYPLCGPSRASLMSGLYTETNGVVGNSHVLGSYRAVTPSLNAHPSMAGFFREQGYFTARVSKIYHMGVPGGIERGDPGGDDPDSWDFATNIMGPETLSDGKLELLSPGNLHYGSNFSSMQLKDDRASTQTDYLATSQAIAILENRAAELPPNGTNKQKQKADAPFFLAVGLVRPHVPLIAPENCFAPYPEEQIILPEIDHSEDVPDAALRMQNHRIWQMSLAQQRKTIQAYMASIRFMDQQVGRLLDALNRLNLREETIIVFVSDHGYNLGEHDCWAKTSLWEGTVRVPMIISAPGYNQTKGTTNASISELIDLYPTLIDLAGFSAYQPKILQGTSLLPAISQGDVMAKKAAYSITQRGKAASIRTDRWRYTCWNQEIPTTNEELYDHHQDPEELINLVSDPNYQIKLNEMRALLAEMRKKAQAKI